MVQQGFHPRCIGDHDDGSTAIATTKGGAETVRVTSSVEDIRRFGTAEYPTYAQAIVSLLAERAS